MKGGLKLKQNKQTSKKTPLLGLVAVGLFERILLKLHGWENNLKKEMGKLSQKPSLPG